MYGIGCSFTLPSKPHLLSSPRWTSSSSESPWRGPSRRLNSGIVIDRFKEVPVDGQSGRGDVHGVAVGSGAGDELGGDIAAGAGLVLDDHLLAPDLREPRADH